MTKWEYTCDTVHVHGEASSNLGRKTEKKLNERGAQGWEVYSQKQDGLSVVIWYKRPIDYAIPPLPADSAKIDG